MVVGRQIYAIGGNAKAASLSGIKTERLTFLTFVNMKTRRMAYWWFRFVISGRFLEKFLRLGRS